MRCCLSTRYIERLLGSEKIKVAEIKAEDEAEGKGKKTYKAPKEEKSHREKIRGASDAMDLISETEDNIDNVLYSTRTISIEEILRAEAEQKKRKEGKK